MLFRSKNINYKFHYLLIYIVILLYNSESKNIKLSLINNESYIQITFQIVGKIISYLEIIMALNLHQYYGISHLFAILVHFIVILTPKIKITLLF